MSPELSFWHSNAFICMKIALRIHLDTSWGLKPLRKIRNMLTFKIIWLGRKTYGGCLLDASQMPPRCLPDASQMSPRSSQMPSRCLADASQMSPRCQMPPRCLSDVSEMLSRVFQMPFKCLSDAFQMSLRCLSDILYPNTRNCLGSRAGVMVFHWA